MFLKIKKNNQGTALILTILIAGVLFALSSFLISQVLINTKIVEKATSEEENYNLAKLGIFYAVDKLNNSSQGENWTPADDIKAEQYGGWYDYSNRNFSLQVTSGSPYITIKSRDLPKKLAIIEAIVEHKSPLAKYVRLIGSNTTFGNNTFGPSGSSAMIQGNAPFCVLGNLTWGNASTATTNNLTLTGDSISIIYGVSSFDETKTNLTINGGPHSGYHYYTDFSDPIHFDTAGGYYFDQAHLPCCYDHSSGTPVFRYGESKFSFWPKIINERKGETIDGNKYENIAKTSGIYISADAHPDESDNWYDCSLSGWEQTYEGGPCRYTGTGTLVVLDGNGETSGTSGQVGIDDGVGEETIAGNDIIEPNEWRPYPSNGLIYSPGSLRVLGIIGDDTTDQDYILTIVSGGNIYIEGNLIKGTDGSSLALLAKNWVALNPTHKLTGGRPCKMEDTTWASTEDVDWKEFDPDPSGSTWGIKTLGHGEGEIWTIAAFDLGYSVLANRITLENLELHEDWELRIYVSNNNKCDRNIVEDSDTLFSQCVGHISGDKSFDYSHPVNLRYIKIWLHTISSTAAEPFSAHIVVASLSGGGNGMWNGEPLVNNLFYAQEKSWAIISGDGEAVSPYAIVIGGCIAEQKQEQSSNWSNWSAINSDTGKPYIYYVADSDLSSNSPPYLPSSVNLISSRRG